MHRLTLLIARFGVSLVLASALFAQSALEADPEDWRKILPDEILGKWHRVPIPPSAGVKPEVQWKVDAENELLLCDGTGQHEWLRYDEELSDFILHVEWKAEARDGEYNGGIGVRMSPYGEIWHQAQTSLGGGYLFGVSFKEGRLQRVGLRQDMSENRLKPAGEWNVYEIRCEGPTISLWVNGATVSTWTGNEVLRGYIGLEAETYPIVFRNLQIKLLSEEEE